MLSRNSARVLRACRKRKRYQSRRMSIQLLETRRLMVAENVAFNVSEMLSAAGLLGSVSAQVDWGDGSVTNATTNGGSATGNLSVQFNYGLDDNQFFNQPGAKAALNFAAASFVGRFSDQFTAIGTNQYVTVTPKVRDPVTGNEIALASNPSIAANKIIVYPGSRNFIGNTAAVGGPGGYDLPSSFSYRTLAEKARIEGEIKTFRDSVNSRGQSGALGTAATATDYAVGVGSISFDKRSSRDWYFGLDPDGISEGQTDFITIATHELAHVFGFGLSNSWNRLTTSTAFRGSAAKAIYPGTGNVPISPEGSHWSNAVDNTLSTIMSASVDATKRSLFSPLDFAAMDDIGYQLVNLDATVTASHRYADDGTYSAKAILKGSQGGVVEYSLGNTVVTNVAPTLSVVDDRSVREGQAFSITNIGSITDPGFRNPNGDPATTETFSYSIQWGDGESDSGTATIDRHGNASPRTTNASFNGSHTYDSPGVKTVRISVNDMDGGTDTGTFVITVDPIPELSVSFANATIAEDDGGSATTLSVSVTGPTSDEARQFNLVSGDLTELTVPATISIPAGASSASVPIMAIDDALLDGDQVSTVTASQTGYVSGNAEITISDVEVISATVSADSVVEGSTGAVNLTLVRSNTDVSAPLQVLLRRDQAKVGLSSSVEIPAGKRTLVVALSPADDDLHELTAELEIVVQASGYSGSVVSLSLIDDEAPLFQNQDNRFDVDGVDGVSVLDALIVINAIAARPSTQLNPATEVPAGQFLDVNGDYRVTALDVLQTINHIARTASAEPEAAPSPSGELAIAPFESDDQDEDDAILIANDAAIAAMF